MVRHPLPRLHVLPPPALHLRPLPHWPDRNLHRFPAAPRRSRRRGADQRPAAEKASMAPRDPAGLGLPA